MKQISEDYVSFEIAKILKNKGFNGGCFAYYSEFVDNWTTLKLWKKFPRTYDTVRNDGYILVPTHQMALKWLREVHDLHIIVYPWQADNEEKAIHWCCTVYKAFAHLGNDVYTNETPKSYEEALETALLYVLKNLI